MIDGGGGVLLTKYRFECWCSFCAATTVINLSNGGWIDHQSWPLITVITNIIANELWLALQSCANYWESVHWIAGVANGDDFLESLFVKKRNEMAPFLALNLKVFKMVVKEDLDLEKWPMGDFHESNCRRPLILGHQVVNNLTNFPRTAGKFSLSPTGRVPGLLCPSNKSLGFWEIFGNGR